MRNLAETQRPNFTRAKRVHEVTIRARMHAVTHTCFIAAHTSFRDCCVILLTFGLYEQNSHNVALREGCYMYTYTYMYICDTFLSHLPTTRDAPGPPSPSRTLSCGFRRIPCGLSSTLARFVPYASLFAARCFREKRLSPCARLMMK